MPQHPSGKAIYARLVKKVLPFWPIFLITILGNALYSGVDSYATYLFKPLLDKGFMGKDSHFLHILPLIILGLFFIRGIAGIVSNYSMGWLTKRMVYLFRKEIFAQLLKLPSQYFDEISSGQLLAKITYNVDQVAQCNNDSLTNLVRQSALVIGLLTVMFLASWQLTLIILIILPLVIIMIRLATKRFRQVSRRIQNGMGNITQSAEEAILGYREVRLFEGQNEQQKAFTKLLDYNFLQEMKLNLTYSLNTPLVQMFGAFALALVIYVAFHGLVHVSAGSFVSMFSAMLMILNPIKSLTQINATIQRGIAAAEGIYELLDHETETDLGTQVLNNPQGHISVQQLSFHYSRNDNLVLNQISFEIPTGKTIALVGKSGSGKTTLVSLITRFYNPTQGKVLFDGVDIQSLSLHNLRSHVSLVSQHVHLFDDSIKNNIAFGNLNQATEDQIRAAAKAAHALDFIEQLPEGFNTRIGENGLKLSGGQRQRIAIARAILKDSPILILDEATSALDNESEKAIKEAIDQLKIGRTTLIIAHRLSTIESADQILVLDQGQIAEQGSHIELMKKGGLYYQLHQAAIVD